MGETVLYSYWKSSASWRIRIILSLKGIEYQYKAINLLKKEHLGDEYRKINKMGQVPAFEIDGLTMAQSSAIAEYLEETHPEPALLPADKKMRAVVREVVQIINSGTQPYQNLALLNRIEELGGKPAAQEWVTGALTRGLGAAEVLVARYHGTYAVGDSVTMADAFLFPQISGAMSRFGIDVETLFPSLYQVYQNQQSHESFKAALPANQPDAV